MFRTVERDIKNLDRPSQKMSKEKLAHSSAMRLRNFVGRVLLEGFYSVEVLRTDQQISSSRETQLFARHQIMLPKGRS